MIGENETIQFEHGLGDQFVVIFHVVKTPRCKSVNQRI